MRKDRRTEVVRRGMRVFLKTQVSVNGSGVIPAGTKAVVLNHKRDTVNLEAVLGGDAHRFRVSKSEVSFRTLCPA